MKTNHGITCLLAPALLLAGCLMGPVAAKALDSGGSVDVTKLLGEAKAEAVELLRDAEDLESYTKSRLSWESHAMKIGMVKEHVNNTGKLLRKLRDAEVTGSPWQQTAIKRIEPLLKELAANIETTINHLNENKARIHLSEFQEYVRANYEMAVNLEALIRDFVNYGEAKQEFERLGQKLGVVD